MKLIRVYIKNQIQEIDQDNRLRWYGLFLSLTMLWTWMLWMEKGISRMLVQDTAFPLCWPFFDNCQTMRFWTPGQLEIFLYGFLGLTLITTVLFSKRRWLPWAWSGLLLLNLVKLGLFWQSYKLMGNYHFMAFLAGAAYLLIPNKVQTLKYLVVGFYVSAGLIKFETEWFSTAAMPEHWIRFGPPVWIQEWGLMPISSAYAVLLEMVIVFGLLSRNKFIFWGTLVQFIWFHLFSWFFVGFFYPCVMSCLLMIYPLDFLISKSTRPERPKFFTKQARLIAWSYLAIYVFLQLWPKLIPGDTALTSEGRLAALNMFDSNSRCQSLILANFSDRTLDLSEGRNSLGMSVRIGCEPHVYLSRAKQWCREFTGDEKFQGISLHLISRRSNAEKYQTIVQLENACPSEISYNALMPNDWVVKE